MNNGNKNGDTLATPFRVGNQVQLGLTKREHFAGLAMQAILMNQNYAPPRRNKFDGMAEDAWHAADALLGASEANHD